MSIILISKSQFPHLREVLLQIITLFLRSLECPVIQHKTLQQNQNDYRVFKSNLRLKVCSPLAFAIKFCLEGMAELGHTLVFLQTRLLTLCRKIWEKKSCSPHQIYIRTATICARLHSYTSDRHINTGDQDDATTLPKVQCTEHQR